MSISHHTPLEMVYGWSTPVPPTRAGSDTVMIPEKLSRWHDSTMHG